MRMSYGVYVKVQQCDLRTTGRNSRRKVQHEINKLKTLGTLGIDGETQKKTERNRVLNYDNTDFESPIRAGIKATPNDAKGTRIHSGDVELSNLQV